MSFNLVLTDITNAELRYAPAIFAAVQIAAGVDTTGETKFQAVVDTIAASSGAVVQAAGTANPQVAGIAALTQLTFSILSALGHLKHTPLAPVAGAASAAPTAASVVIIQKGTI